ncbi:MAG: GTPase Era [Rikenella sp.]|nr:GTPase Era [Rikenella sp.]
MQQPTVPTPTAPHRAGFVNIIGNPNVGKSTLMNRLVGERLSIITSKAQTTRHRIMGIVSGPDFQIVYSDTPGVLKPKYKLQQSMLDFSTGALGDADVLVYVTDTVEQPDKNGDFLAKVRAMAAENGTPVIVVVNKIDLTTSEKLETLVEWWHAEIPSAEIIPVSAREGFNVEPVIRRIVALLPEGPAYYPKETLTDKSLRFFASEIIREKILLNYDKEIPYSTEVAIESYAESPALDRIGAVIYVARQSQKGIVIGHRGAKLKRVGTEARKDLEAFLDKKVFLEIFVKVAEDWRDNDRALRQFGYTHEK